MRIEIVFHNDKNPERNDICRGRFCQQPSNQTCPTQAITHRLPHFIGVERSQYSSHTLTAHIVDSALSCGNYLIDVYVAD
jgi:hypothetical protein